MEWEPLDFEIIFAEVCCGDAEALKFCRAFLVWTHLIDAFVDQDEGPPNPEAVVTANLNILLTFAFNPFWQKHKGALLPVLMVCARQWADSNAWGQREKFRDRASADVLKCACQDVLWFVAKLCGGWEHYAAVTAKWRNYKYDITDSEEVRRLKVRGGEASSFKSQASRQLDLGEVKPHHPVSGDDPGLLAKLTEMLRGNLEAIQFCRTFLRWCHWIDDVIDRDRSWTWEETARVNLEAAVVFSENPFFLRHRERLTPLVVQSFRSFGDSVGWEQREDVKDRRAADVLKSNYHEVFWHASYLAATEKGEDGWAHLAAMTAKYRVFDYDCKD